MTSSEIALMIRLQKKIEELTSILSRLRSEKGGIEGVVEMYRCNKLADDTTILSLRSENESLKEQLRWRAVSEVPDGRRTYVVGSLKHGYWLEDWAGDSWGAPEHIDFWLPVPPLPEAPRKDLAYYKRLPYTLKAEPRQEPAYWTAEYVELPGCKTEGNSEAEAVFNLQELFDEFIQVMIDSGQPIQEPEAPRVIAPEDVQETKEEK